MADPTLKDVLEAIARDERNTATKADLAKLEGKLATKGELSNLESNLKGELSNLESKMDARFDQLEKRFDELDRDLTKHMDVHREIEKDITTLKRRPPRTAARPARRRSR